MLSWALGSRIISFIGGLILTQPVISLVPHMLVGVDRVREWITPAEPSQCRKWQWPWCLYVRGKIPLTPDGGGFGVVCGWCYRTVLLYWFFPTACPWRRMHCLSSCVPLSCMLTISCFLEEEKRKWRVKETSTWRSTWKENHQVFSMLYVTLQDSGWKTHFCCC